MAGADDAEVPKANDGIGGVDVVEAAVTGKRTEYTNHKKLILKVSVTQSNSALQEI